MSSTISGNRRLDLVRCWACFRGGWAEVLSAASGRSGLPWKHSTQAPWPYISMVVSSSIRGCLFPELGAASPALWNRPYFGNFRRLAISDSGFELLGPHLGPSTLGSFHKLACLGAQPLFRQSCWSTLGHFRNRSGVSKLSGAQPTPASGITCLTRLRSALFGIAQASLNSSSPADPSLRSHSSGPIMLGCFRK